MIVLIFDTETTGLPPKKKILSKELLDTWPYIVQLSFIVYDTELCKIIYENDCIVQLPTGVEIPVEVSNINGITTELSRSKGGNIRYALHSLMHHWKNADLIVAHNMSFDLDMIKVELLRMSRNKNKNINTTYYDVVEKATNLYCTMQESIELCNLITADKYGRPYIKFPKLKELHEKLFLTTPSNLHNAFNDVIVCLRCFYKLKFDKDILDYDENIKEMGKKLNMV